jgi:signal transduction histidine kinase
VGRSRDEARAGDKETGRPEVEQSMGSAEAKSDSSEPGRREAHEAARERQSYVRHELRAPLAVMYPALDLLLSGQVDPPSAWQREYLEVLERCVLRLEGAIAAATQTGWLDCAATPLLLEEVDAEALAGEFVHARESFGERAPLLRVEAGLPHLLADRSRVLQALDALVDNAARFAGPKAHVTLEVTGGDVATSVRRREDPASETDDREDRPLCVTLAVRDDGPGIETGELSRVMDFGYVGELARRLERPGLGLGLWVVRELVRAMDGQVTLTSEPGQGCLVAMRLPVVPA